jgi:hypothetical protein
VDAALLRKVNEQIALLAGAKIYSAYSCGCLKRRRGFFDQNGVKMEALVRKLAN